MFKELDKLFTAFKETNYFIPSYDLGEKLWITRDELRQGEVYSINISYSGVLYHMSVGEGLPLVLCSENELRKNKKIN